jgi:flagellar biosynthesis/type III secretory pathway protein FliH
LDNEHELQDFAEEKNASQESSSTNAHLPFVPDVYESVTGKKNPKAQAVTSPVTVAPQDEATLPTDALANPDASAQAEFAAKERVAQDVLLSDQEPDAKALPPLDADASEASADEADTDVADDADASEATTQDEPEGEQDSEPEVQAASEDMPADGSVDASAPQSAEVPAQAEGLDPEVAAQREADKFAEGVAQGMAQGLEQGLAQGLTQGREEGMAQGAQEAREAMAQEVADQCAVLAQVTQDLKALMADPKQFFEPLKRLSVHLAEQLVLGELSHSSKAVERLIQHCLDEVSHPLQDGVVVELNPDDKKRLQAQGGDFLEGLRLEAVPELHPGSVRVFANDMVVEDLVEHRLQALAKNLLVDVPAWQKHSVLAPPELHTDQPEHGDDPA